MIEIIALVALFAGGLWLVRRYRTRGEVDDRWQTGGASASSRIAATHTGGDPVPSGALVPLSRIEARLQATSLSFAVAVLLAGLSTTAMLGWIDIYDNASIVGRAFLHFGVLAYPVTGMALIAANRSTLRDRRESTTELTLATPVSDSTRTLAVTLASWPFAVLLLLSMIVVATANVTGVTPSDPAGGWGPGWIPETLLALTLIAGGAALGVALARWIPYGLVPPVALIGILFVTGGLNAFTPVTNRVRLLAPWTSPPPHLAPEFMIRPSWTHLGYVLGLVAIAIGVAVLRHHRSRSVASFLAVAAVVTLVAALVQLQGPAQAEVQKVAERVNRPGDRCVESRGVRACTARGYEKWRAAWIEAAQRVRATVPVTSPTYVAVQQVGDRGRNALDAEVRERIVGMGTGYGYFGKTRSDDRGFENIAWSVLPANAAVGLPRAVETAGRPCYAGGQARAVLALWALIRATGSEFDTWYLPVATDSDGIGDTWDAANAPWAIAFWPPTWDTDATVPVVYARTDVRLALALAHRTTTQAELRTSWARWTHPAATSTELADAFSVPDPTDARTSRVPGELETCS